MTAPVVTYGSARKWRAHGRLGLPRNACPTLLFPLRNRIAQASQAAEMQNRPLTAISHIRGRFRPVGDTGFEPVDLFRVNDISTIRRRASASSERTTPPASAEVP
jgi:hypothetical protein